MIQQKLRRSGNSYVVTVPRDEVDRLGLVEGQLVSVELTALEVRPRLRPELAAALKEVWPDLEQDLRYLQDR